MDTNTSNHSSSNSQKSSSSAMESARRMSAINRASIVAKRSKELQVAKTANDYIRIQKAAVEFQLLANQAQLQLLQDLASLSDEEQLDTLFLLLDKHMYSTSGPSSNHHHVHGLIHAEYLAEGLSKIKDRVDEAFQGKITLALEKVSQFEKEGHGQLTVDSFEKYMTIVSETIGCTIYEVTEMLVMTVLFSPSLGAELLQDIVQDLTSDSHSVDIQVRKELAHRKDYTRIKALFDMFDLNHDGKVQFRQVVLGMYKITENIQGTTRAAVTALMMCGGPEDFRSMNLEQFTRFIQSIVQVSSPKLTLDYIADVMTRQVANNSSKSSTSNSSNNTNVKKVDSMTPDDDDIAQVFTMDTCLKEVLYINKDVSEGEVHAAYDEDINFGKANQLFQLWDIDQDGYINFHDLALGLRKLEETTSLQKTVEEAEQILQHFNVTHNNKLDNMEFFCFLSQFSQKTEYNLGEMIDFMIVAMILKQNTDKEIKCIDAFSYGVDGPKETDNADNKTYG